MKKFNRLFFILSIILCLGISKHVMAQRAFSLDAIVDNVLKATVPNRNYIVTIKQTINAPNKTKTKQAIANGIFKKTNQFNAKYDIHIGLKAQKEKEDYSIANNQNFKNQSTTNQPILVKQGDVRLIVDFSDFLKTINEWENINITAVNLNNQKYIKVSAKYKQFSFILWINSQYYYVSKSIIYIGDKLYAETNIQYKKINDKYWLPINLAYTQYPEGTVVTQEFSSYIFK